MRQECSKRIDASISPELLTSPQPSVHGTRISTCLKMKMQVKHCNSKCSGTCLSEEKVFQRKSLPFVTQHSPCTAADKTDWREQREDILSWKTPFPCPTPVISSELSVPQDGPRKGGDPTLGSSLPCPGTFCSCCDNPAVDERLEKPSTKSHLHKHAADTLIQPGLVQP